MELMLLNHATLFQLIPFSEMDALNILCSPPVGTPQKLNHSPIQRIGIRKYQCRQNARHTKLSAHHIELAFGKDETTATTW
jgi:hypothetical protein